MKQYKLAAWPDLPPAFRKTSYMRALHDMSQRYVTAAHLRNDCGLTAGEVASLMGLLEERRALLQRGSDEPDTFFGSLRSFVSTRRWTLEEHN